MNSKQILVLILLSTFICGVYSQGIVVEQDSEINIKCLKKYNKWRNQNKRNYLNDDEQLFRQLIFLENLQKIDDHNNDDTNTFTVGTNQFSDMTQEEFVSRILNNHLVSENQNNLEEEESISFADSTISVASSIDWRTKGAVTPIKNQGRCGSCWTFSTVGVMEGFNFLTNKKLQTFSEQQLLDCATPANGYNTQGCKGGNLSAGLTYASKFGALEQSSYPYVGVQGTCKVKAPTNGFKPKTFGRLDKTPEALKAGLNKSPISVSIDATLWSSYQSGVFNKCPQPVMVNHAVLAVGYDAQGNWIVKNSWGSSWGEKGYIRIAAGSTCGITTLAYAISS